MKFYPCKKGGPEKVSAMLIGGVGQKSLRYFSHSDVGRKMFLPFKRGGGRKKFYPVLRGSPQATGFPGVPGSKPSQLLHGRDFLILFHHLISLICIILRVITRNYFVCSG